MTTVSINERLLKGDVGIFSLIKKVNGNRINISTFPLNNPDKFYTILAGSMFRYKLIELAHNVLYH